MINDEWKKTMQDPLKVLETLNKDIGSLMIRERVLPSEDAVRLSILEKEKDAIIKLNEKFAKTDYHSIYDQRVKKDTMQQIEARLNSYGIKLDEKDKSSLMILKDGRMPKLKEVITEMNKIKKETKKRYKSSEVGELKEIVRKGSENVALRRMHSNLLITLEKERLIPLKKMYELLGSVEKKNGDNIEKISTKDLTNLAIEEKKLDDKIKKITEKIRLSEEAIKKLELDASQIVTIFVDISERIRQSTKKDIKESKQNERILVK